MKRRILHRFYEERRQRRAAYRNSYYTLDDILAMLSHPGFVGVWELDAPQKILNRLSKHTKGYWEGYGCKSNEELAKRIGEYRDAYKQSLIEGI